LKPIQGDRGLKLSYSKSLFCEKTTEIRTLQNDLIGTIREARGGLFLVQNVQNKFVELCTYDDARKYILSSYIRLGKPEEKSEDWQLQLF
jgi:hypothetical protein